MIHNIEQANSQDDLTESLNNRAEKLFDHLDDGKEVTYFFLSKPKLMFLLDGNIIKLSKFHLSFYSPTCEFHFHFDERKYGYEISDGCLQLLFEAERMLIIDPNGKKYCYGYKRNNSTDFTLFYYFESGDVCSFYAVDPRRNFFFDVWNHTGGTVNFESLFGYLQPLGSFDSIAKEQEVLFDEDDFPNDLI